MKKFLLLLSLTLLLTGCSQTVEVSQNLSSKQKVAVSFYPLEYITKQIVGDTLQVDNITNSMDPHSYSLTPRDLVTLEEADLFVYMSDDFESWSANVVSNREAEGKLNFSANQTIELKSNDLNSSEFSNLEDHHEDDHHDDDHENDNHDEHDDSHNHGANDPHTWLDPILLIEISQNLTNNLIQISPENQELYEQNLVDLTALLNSLDNSYKNVLASCSNKQAISSHDAFGYLANRYSFKLYPIAGLSPQSEPSSKKLDEIITIAQTNNLTHLLAEEFSVLEFAKVIQDATKLEVLSISTLESTPSNSDFIDTMESNLKAFQTAFSCK